MHIFSNERNSRTKYQSMVNISQVNDIHRRLISLEWLLVLCFELLVQLCDVRGQPNPPIWVLSPREKLPSKLSETLFWYRNYRTNHQKTIITKNETVFFAIGKFVVRSINNDDIFERTYPCSARTKGQKEKCSRTICQILLTSWKVQKSTDYYYYCYCEWEIQWHFRFHVSLLSDVIANERRRKKEPHFFNSKEWIALMSWYSHIVESMEFLWLLYANANANANKDIYSYKYIYS